MYFAISWVFFVMAAIGWVAFVIEHDPAMLNNVWYALTIAILFALWDIAKTLRDRR